MSCARNFRRGCVVGFNVGSSQAELRSPAWGSATPGGADAAWHEDESGAFQVRDSGRILGMPICNGLVARPPMVTWLASRPRPVERLPVRSAPPAKYTQHLPVRVSDRPIDGSPSSSAREALPAFLQ